MNQQGQEYTQFFNRYIGLYEVVNALLIQRMISRSYLCYGWVHRKKLFDVWTCTSFPSQWLMHCQFTSLLSSCLFYTPSPRRPSCGVWMCRVRLYAGDPSLRSNHKHGYRQLGRKRKFDTVYVNLDMAPLKWNYRFLDTKRVSHQQIKKKFCGRNRF
jgi:hypothetical protein